jgi:hypothetical protein
MLIQWEVEVLGGREAVVPKRDLYKTGESVGQLEADIEFW